MSYIYPTFIPVALSLVACNALLTGFFILFKRRDKISIYYMAFSLAVFLWGIGVSFMFNNAVQIDLARSWGRFGNAAALFIPVTWLQFVIAYTKKTNLRLIILCFVYAITAIVFPFTFGELYVSGFQYIVECYNYPMPGVFYHLFSSLFASIVVYSFCLLFTAWQNEKSLNMRKDYKVMFWGTLYGFITGGLSFLPVYDIQWPQYNLFFMPLWSLFLTYALIRHQLFDADEVVTAVRRDRLAAIGTLVTSINHEVKNPLYVIQGTADSCVASWQEGRYRDAGDADKVMAESLKKISQQSQRAIEIMKKFSLFAKQGSENIFHVQKVLIKTAIDNILPLIRHELALDKIFLAIELENEDITAHADPRHIEEILLNLVINAIQAIKATKGPGKIEIKVYAKDDQTIIEIIDNGPGIPKERLCKVFQPFHTTKAEGTGLGLYITKQLVEKNGGNIHVESSIDVGTTFSLNMKNASA